LSLLDAQAEAAQFKADLPYDYQIVEVTEALVNTAMTLAERHGLRGYDAVQLAAALELQTALTASGLPALTLVSADAELNAAASANGLMVEDPNLYP
jgi:predicted nucleic acid-binding protein